MRVQEARGTATPEADARPNWSAQSAAVARRGDLQNDTSLPSKRLADFGIIAPIVPSGGAVPQTWPRLVRGFSFMATRRGNDPIEPMTATCARSARSPAVFCRHGLRCAGLTGVTIVAQSADAIDLGSPGNCGPVRRRPRLHGRRKRGGRHVSGALDWCARHSMDRRFVAPATQIARVLRCASASHLPERGRASFRGAKPLKPCERPPIIGQVDVLFGRG
jgi:hypothetical protein